MFQLFGDKSGSRILPLLILLISLLAKRDAFAAEELDWWKIDREVSRQLLNQEKNLIDWASDLSQAEAQSAAAQ